jgi:uncharacterized protein (DUF1330 family)
VEGRAEPERFSEAGFAAFAARAGEEDGPVTMLNLLCFRPDGGRERYAEYGAAVAPLLRRIGARVVQTGAAGPPLLGGGEAWDMVLLVEYPSRAAFLEMLRSPEYREIGHLRTEALLAGELHPLDVGDRAP